MEGPEPRAPRERPPDVTSAALILIVLGVLGLFANTAVFLNADRITAFSPDVVTAASILGLIVSSLEVMSGVMILRLSNAWRIVGIAIAALGAAIAILNSFSIGFGFGPILIAAADAYVVVTLVRSRLAFSR